MPPKRQAASNTDPTNPTKKTRFVDPADDPAQFEEQIDSALEDPSRRRGQVLKEGYDSDSSDDGEGVVLSRKNAPSGDGDDDEDDGDMFAMAVKDGELDESRAGKKKKDEYLRLGDIEGQVFNNSEDEDSEDEPEDEDDAERRKKAGMGYELSSFNMRDEMEEGKFTEDGNYVRTFDPHGVHDKWMDGLDEKEIKLARRRKRQHDREQQEKIKAEEKELEESGGNANLEKSLLSMLKKGETVLEALQRLGNQTKKNLKLNKVKATELSTINVDKPTREPTDIETITHLASNIMALGDTDIYSKTYEELVRSVRSSGIVDPSWVPPSADAQYEYKWDVPGGAVPSEIFGPYGEEEMRVWMKALYFGPSGGNVKVRQTGGEWGSWQDVLE